MKSTSWNPPPPLNPRAYPLVPLAVCLGLGVFLADGNGYRSSGLLTLALLLLAGSFVFLAGKAYQRPLYRQLLSVGALLIALGLGYWRSADAFLPGRADFFVNASSEDLSMTYLLEVKSIRPGEARLRLETEVIGRSDSAAAYPVSGRLLAYLIPDGRAASVRPGDRIALGGSVTEIPPPDNPFAFDGKRYWATKNIFHRTFPSEEEWVRIDSSGGNWTHRAERWRTAWLNSFRPHLGVDELAVAAALVLGKRDLITEELRSAYADTGAVHVLAVSGLHVGIVAAILLGVLGRMLPRQRKYTGLVVTVLTILGCWAFAWITGFSPSVQRAAAMFSILLLGRLFKRKGYLLNSLAAAAIVMLLWSPFQLFAVGFQLSFAAVAGIGLFFRPINRSIYFPYAWQRSIWSVLSVSLAAQLGTLPFSIYYFHQWPLYFLLTGSMVILTAYAALGLGLLHGLLAIVFPVGMNWSGAVLDFVVRLQNGIVFFGRSLPGARQETAWIGSGETLWWLVVILLLAAWVKWREFRLAVMTLSLMIGLLGFRLAQVQGLRGQQYALVYRTRGHTLIDFVSGRHAFTLKSEELPPRDEYFAADNHRRARGYEIAKIWPLTLPLDTLMDWPGKAYRRGAVLDVLGKRWLLLDRQNPGLPTNLRDVDVVLLRKGHRYFEVLKFLTENEGITSPQFILDNGNYGEVLKSYQPLKKEEKYPLKILSEEGGFRLE